MPRNPSYMRENEFSKRLTKALRRRNALVLNITGGVYGTPGIPDLLIFHPVWNGALELKVSHRKASPEQRGIITRMNECGHPAYVLRLVQKFHGANLEAEWLDLEHCDGRKLRRINWIPTTNPEPFPLERLLDRDGYEPEGYQK